MSKKKHHHEEHEEHVNHEAWVIPYADMLTLLMALFLVMWASSQTDTNKAKQVMAGFADSLGIQGNGQGVGGKGIFDGAATPDKPDAKIDITPKADKAAAALEELQQQAETADAAKEQLEGIQQEITAGAQQNGSAGELAFKEEARGLIVSIVSEGVLFDPGSADLRPEGRAVLDGLAGTLNASPNKLSIEGHTDDRPISTARFPSNWELSTARASAVLRYLVDVHRMDPKRLSASGYGDQQPVAANTDDAGRAKNRRVDIAILSDPAAAETDPKGTP